MLIISSKGPLSRRPQIQLKACFEIMPESDNQSVSMCDTSCSPSARLVVESTIVVLSKHSGEIPKAITIKVDLVDALA